MKNNQKKRNKKGAKKHFLGITSPEDAWYGQSGTEVTSPPPWILTVPGTVSTLQ